MILIELTGTPDEAPIIYEVSQPHLLRLAVVEAYRAGAAIPATVTEAANYLRDHCTSKAAFYSIDDAAVWAEYYTGEQAQLVKFIVRDYQITKYQDEIEAYRPRLKEVI
jgi:hypothetical protein